MSPVESVKIWERLAAQGNQISALAGQIGSLVEILGKHDELFKDQQQLNRS